VLVVHSQRAPSLREPKEGRET